MKTTQKDFEKHLKERITFYAGFLNLPTQTISIKKEEDAGFLSASLSYPYIHTIISYSDDTIEDWKNGMNLDRPILHELLHFITDPFYVKAFERCVTRKEIENERERMVDHLSIIIYDLLKTL